MEHHPEPTARNQQTAILLRSLIVWAPVPHFVTGVSVLKRSEMDEHAKKHAHDLP